MALKENEDFVLVKQAFYAESAFVQESGNMVVTKNHVILNVIQNVDYFGAGTSGAHSIKETIEIIKEAKEAFSDLKKNIQDIKDYGKGVEVIKAIASRVSNIDDFAKEVSQLGAANPKSLNIPRSDIKEFKIGFFKGFQVHLNNGKVIKIRSGKLGLSRK